MNNVILVAFGRAIAIVSMFFGPMAAMAHPPVKSTRTVYTTSTGSVETDVKHDHEGLKYEHAGLTREHAVPLGTITFTEKVGKNVGKKVTVILDEKGEPFVALVEGGGSRPVAMSVGGLKTAEFAFFSGDEKQILFDIQKDGKYAGDGTIEILTDSTAWLTVVDANGKVISEVAIESNLPVAAIQAALMEGTLHDATPGGEDKIPLWACGTPTTAAACAILGLTLGAVSLAIAIFGDDCGSTECRAHKHSHTYRHSHGTHGIHSHTYEHTHEVCHTIVCN